ncbi:GlxA family transcriptional regulator [Tenacibaculum caenipelagi]|uniref:Transcriptional regulator GlxA family with amidase domain n=1 Tax=Tenacibaculum caenipelagi TaxID=1325435 RepID=A0A4V3D302_9FLAO|nr:helix-turn-helix domain-containing protein [Tenacibaculum caenipelagi]TDQ25710.1 transcriptional regulator GlxA family with amidase domain [Tenacibaculum caenipelagi]
MKHLSILVPYEQTTMSTIACIIGSFQVFTEANNFFEKKSKNPLFKISLVGATEGKILQDGFLSIKQNATIKEITETNLIIVPASLVRSYETATKNNKLLIDWIEKQYKQGAEIASMCVGGFMLASTGLLSGKTCSTHWAMADEFRNLFPDINLQTDKLITDENGIYTNGGAYSFLHLLMYLVEKFYDRETAIHCAKYFQIDLDRNLQAEFSIFNGHKKHNDDVILNAQTFMEENYQDKISIKKMSEEFGVSRRNFDRRFIKATGLTPLDYVQRVKIEVAKKSFENSRKSVNEVMYEVGYNDTKAFREVFNRVTGMSPIDYKSKYNKGI